jgi:type IV pilus assembly protein PilN
MIRINLMPKAEARRQAARQRDAQITTLIVVLLVAALGTAEVITRRTANEVQQIADDNQAELIEINKKHEDAILLDKKRTELKAKLETIAMLERQRTGPVHVLADLSTATPDKLWLTDATEVGGSMTLSGKGLDNQTIAGFMRNLAASRYFSNVDLVETKQVEDGLAKLKQFSIKASVIYAGRPAPGQSAAAKPADDEPKAEASNAAAPEAAAADQAKQPAPADPANQPAPADQAKQQPPAKPDPAPALDSSNPLSGTIAAERAAQGAARTSDRRNQAESDEASDTLVGKRQ